MEKGKKTMEEKILAAIKEMSDSEIISLWNEYCDQCNSFDNRIYDMGEFNEIYSSVEPEEIARRVCYGSDEFNKDSSFNPNRDYFYFDGYGNPVSFDYIYNECSNEFYGNIDIDSLIDYIIENNDSLCNDEIQEILDSFENE